MPKYAVYGEYIYDYFIIDINIDLTKLMTSIRAVTLYLTYLSEDHDDNQL